MRHALTTICGLVVVPIFTACDPVYFIGARMRLRPMANDSCALASMSRSFGRGAIDGMDSPEGATVPLKLAVDSSGRSWSNVQLRYRPERDSTALFEIITGWMGTARSVPVDQQRRFVAAATSVLQRIRLSCLPDSAAKVECVARGLGGHAACETGR